VPSPGIFTIYRPISKTGFFSIGFDDPGPGFYCISEGWFQSGSWNTFVARYGYEVSQRVGQIKEKSKNQNEG